MKIDKAIALFAENGYSKENPVLWESAIKFYGIGSATRQALCDRGIVLPKKIEPPRKPTIGARAINVLDALGLKSKEDVRAAFKNRRIRFVGRNFLKLTDVRAVRLWAGLPALRPKRKPTKQRSPR